MRLKRALSVTPLSLEPCSTFTLAELFSLGPTAQDHKLLAQLQSRPHDFGLPGPAATPIQSSVALDLACMSSETALSPAQSLLSCVTHGFWAYSPVFIFCCPNQLCLAFGASLGSLISDLHLPYSHNSVHQEQRRTGTKTLHIPFNSKKLLHLGSALPNSGACKTETRKA